jgi:hypothetical protein
MASQGLNDVEAELKAGTVSGAVLPYNGTGDQGANPLEFDVNVWYQVWNCSREIRATGLQPHGLLVFCGGEAQTADTCSVCRLEILAG